MWFTIYLVIWYTFGALANIWAFVADKKIFVKASEAIWNTPFLLSYAALLLFVFHPLTWFGWFLFYYFIFNCATNMVIAGRGGWTSPRWSYPFYTAISVFFVVMLLTVGISA